MTLEKQEVEVCFHSAVEVAEKLANETMCKRMTLGKITQLTQEQTLQEFNSVLHDMSKEKGAESIEIECWRKLKHAYGKKRPRGRSTDRAESGEMGGKARSRSGSRAESSGSSDALPGGELD